MSGLIASGHLSRVSRHSANDKIDNEVKPKAVHRSPGIYLTAEENPEKISASRTSDESNATGHHLKWGLLPSNDVGRIVQHVKQGEGR